MRRWMFMLTITACFAALTLASVPRSAQADEYWDGYWSWYDGTYRPYYTRRYYADPYYYGPYTGPSYGYYSGGVYYYGRPRYYGEYYGTPNFGYSDFPGGGGQVRVGPLRFGWR